MSVLLRDRLVVGLLIVTCGQHLQALARLRMLFCRSWSLTACRDVAVLAGFARVLRPDSLYLVIRWPRRAMRCSGFFSALRGNLAHALLWYFSTLSQISTVYGSLATAITGLLSMEVAATLLLLGAQVISEYERFDPGAPEPPAQPFRTESAG